MKSSAFFNSFKSVLISILKETYKTSLVLFKIMIPVTIVVKILQETGGIEFIGKILSPVMRLTGLPGEMGIVWATGMISNIYGGIIAFFNIYSFHQLTVAQVTVLTTMMLIAHNFPIELQVAKKAGVKIITMFVIRFGFGLIFGILLNIFYRAFNLLQQPAVISWKPSRPLHPAFNVWLTGELKNYVYILIIIFLLTVLMKILKETGVIRWLNKLLKPALGVLGISESIIPITIIGLTLGVAYGGALIIRESKLLPFNRRDIFYSFVLMGLCHSVIEDSLLMISVGGHFSGVLIGRLIYTFVITWFIVRITRNFSENTFQRLIFARQKTLNKNQA